jgi:Cu/Ag efflux protein CusF
VGFPQPVESDTTAKETDMKLRLAFTCAALAAASAVAPPAFAQHDHATAAPATQAAAEMAEGEVRRVDAAKGTVLLKHGEIKSIGMGAMTMGFKLKDPAWATTLKVGDKVRFAVAQEGEDLVVTQIQKVD